MKTLLLLFALMLPATGTAAGQGFVAEPEMKAGLMQMLARFTVYMKNDFQDCVAPNSVGEACGCFKGEHTMASDERGVRPNADLGMICAFLVKYGKGKVELPAGVDWDDLEQMAMKSLVFSYSTHKANRLKVCAGNDYWGSTSASDHVWESSLWALSVAYSAFFQWDRLSKDQQDCVYRLLKAECDYELQRDIPTGFAGDTKAEENGWEAGVLAAALGLFPDDALAPKWFDRMREFAINSYSHEADANDDTVLDPEYDGKRVKDFYRGANLYSDYTLQNHNYFHTSYQNVVIQELGEAALAMKLFQRGMHGKETWRTNALMHNNDRVMRDVLYWLALPDGELAMPNGNDWSLFLYDQITSYSTNACFLRDPHALLLENRAFQMIRARQQTTPDGSWLLRPDVGARRMGVQAHRVMMTWLMHDILPTAGLAPTTWSDFARTYEEAKVFTSQNIVRAASAQRFTCFSWSEGLRSYTGYIAPFPPAEAAPGDGAALKPEASNLIVPFRANNTGNFLGWYELKGKKTNARPTVSGIYDLKGNAYLMNGALATNDGALDQHFLLYSSAGNAVVYIDNVYAKEKVTVLKEKGGLMAVSVDACTKQQRQLHTAEGTEQADGSRLVKKRSPWVNIDDCFGVVSIASGNATDRTDACVAFGETANNNSVMTAKLYAAYSDSCRDVEAGAMVGSRALAYYSNVTAEQTKALERKAARMDVPEGWGGAIVPEPDGTASVVLANFAGTDNFCWRNQKTPMGIPVLSVATGDSIALERDHAFADDVRFFVDDPSLITVKDKDNPNAVIIKPTARRKKSYSLRAVTPGGVVEKNVKTNKTVSARIVGNDLVIF